MAVESGKGEAAFPAAGKERSAKRRSGAESLGAERLGALRKGGADAPCKRLAELVGQPGRDVAFMHYDGHAAHGCAEDGRYADEAAR